MIYIPYEEADEALGKETLVGKETNDLRQEGLSFRERDLRGGYDIRLKIYRDVWQKCLNRVQNILNAIYAPVADEIVQQVETAYNDVLPGLPYSELPVISISAPASGSTFVNEIAKTLGWRESGETDNEEEATLPANYVTHIRPFDCTNIMSAMKALVTGFIDRPPGGFDVKRKTTTSLANCDIALLNAWYTVIRECHDISEPLPQLIVFIHDFEQVDGIVLQDLFYICSRHIPQLPLVFVLSLSSPPSPSYLHSAYPRSTLSLLRVQNFKLPSGTEALEKVLMETFFDSKFESDIIIGPTVLEFLADFFTRHSSFVDGVLTILQVAYLKHFEEPLTIFAQNTLFGTTSLDHSIQKLEDPSSFPFVSHLVSRFLNRSVKDGWPIKEISVLLASVTEAQRGFSSAWRTSRSAFAIMRFVQRTLLDMGYRSAELGHTVFEAMAAALQGQLSSESMYLGAMIKKLHTEKLLVLLTELQTFLQDIPSDLRDPVNHCVTDALQSLKSGGKNVDAFATATTVGSWLTRYWQSSIVNLEDFVLWDVWYMGSTPYPSELINPSPHAAVLSGLQNPYGYIEDSSDGPRHTIWELPDVSILFRRYLEAGRMVNVYDWFEAFAVVLETQRKHAHKIQGREVDDRAIEGQDEWKMHVQARFIQSLHTLDLLGFIRHTGRKADHVMRTTFEVSD